MFWWLKSIDVAGNEKGRAEERGNELLQVLQLIQSQFGGDAE